MELWIRSQVNEKIRPLLLKVNEFEIGAYNNINCIVVNNLHCVGIYKSEERALEVMKEIEAGILYTGLPQREIEVNLRNKDIKMQGNCEFNTITNVALYTMPEE